MIPRHRPPFGAWEVLAAFLSSSGDVTVEKVEDAFATAYNLPQVVLLPSARAGICWALRASISLDTTIIGPAYTCRVVHEAITRARARIRFMDTAKDSFLMDPIALTADQSGDYAVVLCEMFGDSYDLHGLATKTKRDPRVRILDIAMTVPTRETFTRMEKKDFAVISFGLGKCVYAGWGGLGMTGDSALAQEVRRQRDACVHDETLPQFFMRSTQILFRTLAHERILYGSLQKFRAAPIESSVFPSSWDGDNGLSKEWYLPSTPIDRRLAIRNFERSTELNDRRLVLARLYQKNLADLPGIILPSFPSNAMSHYTIRVPAKCRDNLRTDLLRLGVDTGTLFHLPSYLSEADFPNAARISDQVVNLPLDSALREDDVDYISNAVIRCMSELQLNRQETKQISTFSRI